MAPAKAAAKSFFLIIVSLLSVDDAFMGEISPESAGRINPARRGGPIDIPSGRFLASRDDVHAGSRGGWDGVRPDRLTVGALLLGALLGLAVLADRLSPQDPIAQDRNASWGAPGRFHPMGTDPLGRDVLARVAHAARAGLLAVAPGALLAVLTAALAVRVASRWPPQGWRGTARGALDRFVLLPSLALALIAAQIVRCDSPASLALLLGFTTWGPLARAALGGGPAAGLPVSRALSHAGWLLVIESILSWLGLGLAAPSPSWGAMVREGLGQPLRGWWAWLFPGAALALSVAAFRMLGGGGLRPPSLFSRHK
jgi:peptide/nickel transport system permease protein